MRTITHVSYFPHGFLCSSCKRSRMKICHCVEDKSTVLGIKKEESVLCMFCAQRSGLETQEWMPKLFQEIYQHKFSWLLTWFNTHREFTHSHPDFEALFVALNEGKDFNPGLLKFVCRVIKWAKEDQLGEEGFKRYENALIWLKANQATVEKVSKLTRVVRVFYGTKAPTDGQLALVETYMKTV